MKLSLATLATNSSTTPAVLVAGFLLVSGCDSKDVSMQAELASLREQIRKAETDRDRALRDKSETSQKADQNAILPLPALRESLGKLARSIEQNAIAAFPGYRPGSLKTGRLAYLYDSHEPYSAWVEVGLSPISPSALTPELPKMVIEVRAASDGTWNVPSQAALREIQAGAVAKANADKRPTSEQTAPVTPPSRNLPPTSAPQSPATAPGGVRTIDWGDSQPNNPPAPSQQPRKTQPPSGSSPRSTESHEIRFN